MKLFLTRTFQERFQTLSEKTQSEAEKALKEISVNPYKGKKLAGELEVEFSFRLGKYRIIYFIDKEENIWIETIRHRKDVYRKK